MVTVRWEGIPDSEVTILYCDWNDHATCDRCGQHNTRLYKVDWSECRGTLCSECFDGLCWDRLMGNDPWQELVELVKEATDGLPPD